MVKKKGKKSSGQREEQAAGGQPQMKTVRQRVGSSQHEHQKQHEAPPVLSSGCVAGPSQQSQGQRDQGPQNCSQPQNQQPLNPPTYDADRGRGQGNPRAGTVRQQTGDAEVAAITKGIQTLKIPNRTGCGTKGRKTAVETNYLSLDLSKLRNKIAIHYDVEFKPSPFPKRLLRRAMEEFRRINFPDRFPAFDGRKNLYSTRELPEKTDSVMVQDEEYGGVKQCEITITYTSQVNLGSLSAYMSSDSTLEIPQKAIQAVDVVLRNAPSLCGCVQVGRSFYTPPRGRILKLSDGLEMWYGVFQSATLGWKPFVNIDVTHKGFPLPQRVVEAIYEICRPQDDCELNKDQKEDFESYIRGKDLKVDYMIPNNPTSKRTFRVNTIAECPAKLRFQLDDGQRISVQEYFTRVKCIKLRYPHLPCLHVGSLNRKNPIYLPPELCSISKHQVINKKMSDKQTSAMIKHTATSTDMRKRKIMEMLSQVRFNDDPCVREFGLSVGEKFEEVSARILDAPQLEYKNQRFPTIPSSGVWRASNFVSIGNLKSWIILNLDSSVVSEDALRCFGEEMQKTGKKYGMNIPPPVTSKILQFPAQDTSELQTFFTSMKHKRVDLIVVVIPDVKNSYAKVKQIAELDVGVLTQCIKSRTMQRMNPATCSNILLKVNSKLNGVNHTLSSVSRSSFFESPVMIVGADVTHPSPDQTDIPSVVAVCASHDPKALFKYNIQIRLQPPKVEIIQDLQAIIKEQLLYFRDATRYLPNRIIFYRDGVSEGEFAKVLNSEVTAVRRACSSVEQGYKPMVTFLVVQKRHHTRFFPTSSKDEDGKNRNVPPGTLVDTDITHPVELGFFLVSHASIQGVSRPTKYHLLWNDDNVMTTDDLEQLTYYLCHMFSRCTRSVSYPAPTYNAHLAASRARVYLDGRKITLTNLANEQRKYFESSVLKAIIKDFPMYFV